MKIPAPTPIFRLLHVNNLPICLHRGALYAPKHTPTNGLDYKTIHNVEIQEQRKATPIICGPGGVIHDYIAFYFGPRSPMLFQLHTGRVKGYAEGQVPLIYLVSSAQAIKNNRTDFVFSDGHGIAMFTNWFDDLRDLDKVDWETIYTANWKDTVEDMDRQRRKQAEFLVYQHCDWGVIEEIGVINENMKENVEKIFGAFDAGMIRPVYVRPDWYY